MGTLLLGLSRSFGELAGGGFCIHILGVAVRGFGDQQHNSRLIYGETRGSKITNRE